MSIWTAVGYAVFALLVLALMLALANLGARVGRYLAYRRAWPAAPRARVWRHVR